MVELTEGAVFQRKTLFVEVILPLFIKGAYTYRVPFEWNEQVAPGKRVIVQFGAQRIYAGLIYKITEEAPKRYEAKYVLDILDEEPIINSFQFKLWEWISSYYLCHLGEVMQAALPGVFKLASETLITKGDLSEVDMATVQEKEFLILDALDLVSPLKINDIVKLLGQKTVFPLLKRMFDKKWILISEEISEKYKPKTKAIISLAPEFSDDSGRKSLLDGLNRAPKQQDAVLAFLQLQKSSESVGRKEIMEVSGCSAAIISALVEKGVFLIREQVVSRLGGEDQELSAEFTLSERQQEALDQIKSCFEDKDVVLLHGVTSSGKTEIFIRLIESALAEQGQVLYLLPEIALTTQITERLKLHFGSRLGVYHSRFNDNERAELWSKVLKGTIQVVIGARSSIFLPFNRLNLVIIDEEHETSYKQFDPAPRYHARDTAVFAAHLHGAKVLLGSATPSIESYYNAKSGKYGFVQLKYRFGQSIPPDIRIVDIKEEARKEKMHSYFSEVLLNEMKEALARREQVILFQNRRGHTPLLQCKTCGNIAKCLHCDVSLTLHKSTGKMHCHYCGYAEEIAPLCMACGSSHIESRGFGTERIEEELELLLPDAKIGRLDMDSTKGKYGFQRVLEDFENQNYHVLVGTQMVAKGLDFGNVHVIGIINADNLIHFPEFRAHERAFSLMAQVAGRAGRRQRQGKVIIQTYSPTHRVLTQVVNDDYESLFKEEIHERKTFSYPPFFRLIRIEIKHKQQEISLAAGNRLAFLLKQSLGERVLGPEQPLIARIRNQYLHHITIKIERSGTSLNKIKEFIHQTIQHFGAEKPYKGTRVLIDVDPY